MKEFGVIRGMSVTHVANQHNNDLILLLHLTFLFYPILMIIFIDGSIIDALNIKV